ncbi:MAG: hypothetical protein Tsb0014_45310 [Pleurocapsa sp.]
MSQRNGFSNGFILGSILGGVVGGVLGTLLATRNESKSSANSSSLRSSGETALNSEESIELARHGLEDKIAQLNLAIDDVRQQLDSVHRNSVEEG